jgi:hypothetical protein
LVATALIGLGLILAARLIMWRKTGAPERKPSFGVELVKLFSFSGDNALKEWEDKIFKGKVVYKIEKDKDLSYVQAHSTGSASALYYKIKLDARKRRPVLKWKWHAEKFPVKNAPESLEASGEDDFAGRVYIIFPAMFILNSNVIEYIWAEKLPAGTIGTSPYSKNIKLMVLESGPAKDGKFISEDRDVVADYIKMFGKPPEHDIGAVAFMTNAEHTNTSADAMYDEIGLGYKEK